MTTQISVETLAPISYNNIPVITTELLAILYGTTTHSITKNHRSNVDRFVCGKHYFKVDGEDLKEFKNKVTNSDLVASRAKHLILWTERGAARHAKMLETDQAWEVFEKLEDCYFSQRQPEPEQPLLNCELYISIRDGEIVSIKSLSKGEYVLSLSVYEEMLARQGYEVIHKKDLRNVAKKYLLELF